MLTECVVNISEGRNIKTISEVVRHLEANDARILHVDRGDGAHRTVITLVADSSAMPQAILALYEVCLKRIDMNVHKGCHPRIGAVDVCPFIPLEGQGVRCPKTVEKLQNMCAELGEEIAQNFGLPVYLYGLSTPQDSKASDRTELSYLRKGGFESLATKMLKVEFAPNYGPAKPHPTGGATVLGVRDFLVAYNITLDSSDLKIAKMGAKFLRALPGVKALGWFIPEYGRVQISCNITNIYEVSIVDVYNQACEFAQNQNVRVSGSEVIGLIPLHNLLLAFEKNKQSGTNITLEEFIPLLIDRLGLSLHGEFNPKCRILEWVLQ